MDPFDYLDDELQHRINKISDCLIRGNIADFTEYKYLCGQARGLLAAQEIILDLKSTMEQTDD